MTNREIRKVMNHDYIKDIRSEEYEEFIGEHFWEEEDYPQIHHSELCGHNFGHALLGFIYERLKFIQKYNQEVSRKAHIDDDIKIKDDLTFNQCIERILEDIRKYYQLQNDNMERILQVYQDNIDGKILANEIEGKTEEINGIDGIKEQEILDDLFKHLSFSFRHLSMLL